MSRRGSMRRDRVGWDCGGVSSKFVVGCDKIRSGRLIERRSGGCRRAVSRTKPLVVKYAKGKSKINSFKKRE